MRIDWKLAPGVAGAALAALLTAGAALSQAAPIAIQPLHTAPDPGSYLAARAADRANDFGAASEWFLRALADDPQNPDLLENCIAAMIGIGRFDSAQPLAARLAIDGAGSQLAHMVLMANAAATGDWAAVQTGLEADQRVSPMIDGLANGWALVAEARRDDALAAFDALAADRDTRQFGLYHKALALAVLGDLAGADAALSAAPRNGMALTRRSILVHAQILSQLGQPDRATAELSRFGEDADATVLDLRAALAAGETLPLTLVSTPAEGLGEGLFGVARVLMADAPETASEEFVLRFARTAEFLHPGEAEYMMMTAGLLERLGRHELAGETYAAISATDPLHPMAEFGRADVLRAAGRFEDAAAVLGGLASRLPDLAMAHAELADVLRRLDRNEAALASYDTALALLPEGDRRIWRVRFLRGVTAYDLGDWTSAEIDLRAAYALNPDDAGLLNFLGYSLVERGENLDEALGMIVRAVEAEPGSGAILDSYGWALYRLDRAQEAVTPMERAVRLTPENAFINDHLGDIYWSVGRLLEARFQWQRALSFETDVARLAAIRAKLDHGLVTEARAEDSAAQDP